MTKTDIEVAEDRVKAAEDRLRELYRDPAIASARQESQDAAMALSSAHAEERFGRLTQALVERKVVQLRSAFGNVIVPSVSEYLGKFDLSGVVLVLDDGSEIRQNGNLMQWIPGSAATERTS
jgi:hypothetical protein